MSKELIERLSKHRPGKGDLDDEAADRIKQLLRRIEYLELCCDEGERQLAASQIREVQLREFSLDQWWYKELLQIAEESGVVHLSLDAKRAIIGVIPNLLAKIHSGSDTNALEAMIEKAGDVMRERCANACTETYRPFYWDKHGGSEEWPVNNSPEDCSKAIRALPGVTLEDLK